MLRPLTLLFATAFAATAQEDVGDFLRRLADAPGPPGFEEPIRKIMTAPVGAAICLLPARLFAQSQ